MYEVSQLKFDSRIMCGLRFPGRRTSEVLRYSSGKCNAEKLKLNMERLIVLRVYQPINISTSVIPMRSYVISYGHVKVPCCIVLSIYPLNIGVSGTLNTGNSM